MRSNRLTPCRPPWSLPETLLPDRLRQRVRWPWRSPSAVCVHYPDRWSCSAPHLEVLKGGRRLICLPRRLHQSSCRLFLLQRRVDQGKPEWLLAEHLESGIPTPCSILHE